MIKIIKNHIINLSFFMGLLLFPHAGYAASITLEWIPGQVQPLADIVAGYRIYCRTKSGTTLQPIDAHNETSYKVDLPDENEIYYCAVKAYTGDGERGEESEKSAEVSTFNEFTGTASINKFPWGSCGSKEVFDDSCEVRIAFNYLPAQGSFIFEPQDTRFTCNAGTFIQGDENEIMADCVKKGPLDIVTFYNFKFRGSGNASLKDPLSLSANVFNIFNQDCPVYSIIMEDLVPVQQ